ncbi:MAG: hypothetical protein AAF488_14645 [Planctomycetota bacterium]
MRNLYVVLAVLSSTLLLESCSSQPPRDVVQLDANGGSERKPREVNPRAVGTPTKARAPETGSPKKPGGAELGPSDPKRPSDPSGDEGRGDTKPSDPDSGTKPRKRNVDPLLVADAQPDPVKPKAGQRLSVAGLIRRLQAGPPGDVDALREIQRIPPHLVPALIEQVDHRGRTQIRELAVPAYHDDIAVIDPKSDLLFYYVKGMGKFAFDDVATGPLGGTRRGTRVVFRTFTNGFLVGEVVRAALLHRFRSGNYPSRNENSDIVAWWRDYYAISKTRIAPSTSRRSARAPSR